MLRVYLGKRQEMTSRDPLYSISLYIFTYTHTNAHIQPSLLMGDITAIPPGICGWVVNIDLTLLIA